jgi:hypothetical protein
VKVETWKCNADGSLHKSGNFIKRDAMMLIQPGETVQQLLSRLSAYKTAPVGMVLEGPVLVVQPDESMPELHPPHFATTPIHGMINMAAPRLIIKVHSKQKKMGFFFF